MKKIFTTIVECDSETKQHIGTVSNLPGTHTMGNSIEEVREKLKRSDRTRIGRDA